MNQAALRKPLPSPVGDRNECKKPVFCHQTGQVYPSHADAIRALKTPRPAGISQCVRGRLRQTGGYTFANPTPAQLRKAGL